MRGPGSRCLTTAAALMFAIAGCGGSSPAGPGNTGTSGVDGGAGAGGRSGSGGGSEGGTSGGAGGAAGSTGGAAGVPDGGQGGDAAGASGGSGGSGATGGTGGAAGNGSGAVAGGGVAGGGSSGAAGGGSGGAAGTSSGGTSGGAAGGGSSGAAGDGSGGAAGVGSGGMSGSGGAAGAGGMSGGGGSAGGVSNGGACLVDGNCMSGHCANGFCCASGDCCAVDANCASFGHAPMCGSQATCQGTRIDGVCNSLFRCITTNVDDDTACAGLIANDCGPYASVACTAAAAQPADQAARCATGCTGDSDCDAAAHCSGTPAMCVADGGAGSACSQANQCASGLTCVDNVCCTSACTGGCMSCALPGSVGTCAPIPSGQDPGSECGAVSCVGQYFGWVGNSCFRKADVPAAQAACDGAGACRTTAEECTSQTTQGPTTIACQATCQSPNVATCSGATAGTCANVNPGNQSCGNGVCRVTVPLCVNGALNSCTPNSSASSAETCNDLDDNCDGTIDNGTFADSREPNDSCANPHLLPTVGSDQTVNLTTAGTLFPAGDVDTYRINAVENDGSCACCDIVCTDEDYELTVTLSVPLGAGSYQLCAARDVCTFGGSNCITVNANASGSLSFRLDGSCVGGSDQYAVYVRVAAGSSSPGTSCKPYGLSYFFDAGRCF